VILLDELIIKNPNTGKTTIKIRDGEEFVIVEGKEIPLSEYYESTTKEGVQSDATKT